jgi:hypothetical protein|mmetsp:Transcript_26941/g.31684  ORF Transcript_26941/g.31684 Transcript_26941/m.31684 type:complete len:298 (+) Transcript_26941:1-894(+)
MASTSPSGLVRNLTVLACGFLAASAESATQSEETFLKEPKVSPNLMTTLKSSEKFERVETPMLGNKPVVGLKSYLFDDDNTIKADWATFGDYGKAGYKLDYHTDLFASFDMPTYWMLRQGTNWLIYNPNFFIEASAEGSGTLFLSVVELTISVKLMLGKYTPFDYQMAWDLDQKSRVCYSLSYFWEVFDLEVSTEWNINECSFGLLGYISKQLDLIKDTDYKSCTYRRYITQTPIYQVTLQDRGDVAGDYIPWVCNDYAELEQERTPVDENGNDIDNPVGFDDLPEEQEEEDWTYDP